MKKSRRITIVAGARPNFIKIAPIIDAIEKKAKLGFAISYRLVHTGQHYDKNMSGTFFEELNIPHPDTNLEVHGGTHTQQTASIMLRFEEELLQNPPDLVLVVGDVNSTMACALVAQKSNIKVAHVEGGIRSEDWNMPEEINRLVTDSISNYFFTTSVTANQNLKNSGVDVSRIFFVGNTMIDTLIKFKSKLRKPEVWDKLQLKNSQYLLLTMHRPANVSDENKIETFLNEILKYSHDLPIVFPVHPRTASVLAKMNFNSDKLHLLSPMGYLEFNYLTKNAKAVITDSGGITEETTVMGIPCLTLRDNTERPETITIGTNELIGTNPKSIKPALNILFDGQWKKGEIPKLWDGKTAERIVDVIVELDL